MERAGSVQKEVKLAKRRFLRIPTLDAGSIFLASFMPAVLDGLDQLSPAEMD
jgi:hypothetical protein